LKYETFRTNFCKRDSELSIKRLRQYLDQFMLRRTHADQLFGRPILKLKDLKSKTIAVEFNTVERYGLSGKLLFARIFMCGLSFFANLPRHIYRIVKERFVQHIRLFVRHGSIEKKYQSIFTLDSLPTPSSVFCANFPNRLLRLRQLTCHCFLVQNTFKELLEEADLQRLWKLTEDESDPGNQSMIQGLKFTLGNATADIPQPPGGPATRGPITYRFRKYLQSMRDDGKWAEIIDRTSESPAAAWPPPHPQILTVCSVHSLQRTSYEASYHGLQSYLLLRMPQSTFLECCYGRQQTGLTMSGVWRPL
jgi:SNF2 family DNA or RNA helicase